VTAYPKPAAGQPKFPRWKPKSWTTGTATTRSVPALRVATAHRVRVLRRPPFANGLPHYGQPADRLCKGHRARATAPCALQGERRFGWDPRLARRARVQRQLGISDKAQIEEMGIGKFTRPAARRAQVHQRMARLRHPARRAGWTSTTTTRHSIRLHGIGDLGVQAAVDKGLPTKAIGCCRTAGTTKRRCPATNCG